jgi:hypothetical protein
MNGDIFRLEPIAVKEDASLTESRRLLFDQHFIAAITLLKTLKPDLWDVLKFKSKTEIHFPYIISHF